MAGTVPTVGKVASLTDIISSHIFTVKLFSNDITPAAATTAGSLTEVAGGGYADFDLQSSDWTVTAGSPSQALAAAHSFTFTGPTTAPGTIYGVYIVDEDNILRGAERFEASVVPFTPVIGSVIRVTPKLTS